MKERPILFSPPMVRAILFAARKTQTRRLFKHNITELEIDKIGYTTFTPDGHISIRGKRQVDGGGYAEWFVKCPFGQTDDQLWVRETFCQDTSDGKSHFYVYKADYPDYPMGSATWKPSIHMPRIASRISLQITTIRVERLQDISREDAIAEGVFYHTGLEGYSTDEEGRNFHASDPRISYCKLWCSIHSPESWDLNPWVWVIEFKKI